MNKQSGIGTTFELSATAKKQISNNLTMILEKMNQSLNEHNNSKNFCKKEVFEIQGFKIRAISKSHAYKRVRKLLLDLGAPIGLEADYAINLRLQLLKDTADDIKI